MDAGVGEVVGVVFQDAVVGVDEEVDIIVCNKSR